MGFLTLPTTFADGVVPTAAQFNGDFQTIVNEINGALSNANIAADAAIALTKLATTPATVTGSETLTNKTLTAPIINNPLMKGAYEAWVTDVDGATITMDLSAGNKHRVTLGGNRTLALSNVQNGHAFAIKLTQDGTGSRTVTWFSTISWAGGSAPTLTTTLNKSDVFGFIQTGTNTYDGFIVGQSL